MTAAWQPEPELLADPSATADRVESVLAGLAPVDLATLESQAGLLTRIDRKYVVPLTTLERLVDTLGDDWRALEIGGRRLFGYTSTYFDTDDLRAYRDHLQRRRRRFKVRVRRYTDADLCLLEVKRKGLRGVTVKERTPHPTWSESELGPSGHAFVASSVRGHAPMPTAPMSAVVSTSNRRGTVVSLTHGARMTVDTDLACGWGARTLALRPGYVLLETKTDPRAHARLDLLLHRLGERPLSISKYCVGVAALRLGVPDNPWRRTIRRYFETSQSVPS